MHKEAAGEKAILERKGAQSSPFVLYPNTADFTRFFLKSHHVRPITHFGASDVNQDFALRFMVFSVLSCKTRESMR